MRFFKLQATGNDFILVDTLTQTLSLEGRGLEQGAWAELAQAMCNRHFGVGADGLILVQDSTIADLKMRIFNPDGSEAEVCGNGLRCFAKYVIERGMSSYSMTVETLSGIRKIEAHKSGNKVNQVEVNMGMPQFQPDQIPLKAEVDIIPILDYPLVVNDKKLTLSILSMGNPHAVSFSAYATNDFPLGELGPKVEWHPIFPQRTNFEVARVLGRGKIEARVWERGTGETLACGSGACAIAVSAQLLDYADEQVDIMLKGGILTVSWDRVGEVLLAGPVEEVFRGEWLE